MAGKSHFQKLGTGLLFDFRQLHNNNNLYLSGRDYTLNEDFGKAVGAGTGDVRPRRVEGHVQNAFIELLPVCGDLLNTRLVVQVPQPDATVVA